jgi:hypothetical protein
LDWSVRTLQPKLLLPLALSLSFFFFAVLVLELIAYHLSHATSGVMEEARTGCQKTELLAAQSCEDPKQPRIPFYWISQTRANEHGRRRKKRRGSKRSCFLLKLES